MPQLSSNTSDIPILKRLEVASHISKESVSGIPISSKMMKVASPFRFRRWSWHPHVCSEGGGVIPMSLRKVQVATTSHLRNLRWHPHLFSGGADIPFLFLEGGDVHPLLYLAVWLHTRSPTVFQGQQLSDNISPKDNRSSMALLMIIQAVSRAHFLTEQLHYDNGIQSPKCMN